MFSFFERFLGNKLDGDQPAAVPVQVPIPQTNAYDLLSPADKEVVRAYFGAATDVCRLLDSLRRHEQVAHEMVLARFERAEKYYSGLGFLPILPSSTRSPGQGGSPLFEAKQLPERGFLVRRESGRLPHFYASAVKKHVARLRDAKVRPFASSPRVALLKTATVPQQSQGYQAWNPEA